ncbi:MAG: zinc-ribbon domain-containing protein [Polyangiaceae bacterium]|nr:zinc-ribbon domain-containing protein [Polyangiaceae bacterium]
MREIDPDFRPRPPAGAVLGDIRAQSFCPVHHVPRYYYVDQQRACVQCGLAFTFRAAEQKFWYETLKFHFDSVPIRCPTCRRSRRSDVACRVEVQEAKAAVARAPRDPALQLSLARALVRHRQRLGSGDLDEAIHAARAVRRLSEPAPWPGSVEADYWEGAAHAAAGRSARARTLFTAFLAHRPPGRHLASLGAEAASWLQTNPASPP